MMNCRKNERRRNIRLAASLVGSAVLCAAAPAFAQIAFSKADLYFELNATDGDIGLHGLLDGEAWSAVRIVGPGGQFEVIRAVANDDSPEFGVTELFFESNEPPLANRSFAELLALFPPGQYDFLGTTTVGQPIVGEDILTAAIPCPVNIEASMNHGELSIEWTLAPGAFDPDTGVCKSRSRAVRPIGVQVVMVLGLGDGSERVFSADMPPQNGDIEIPEEFLAGEIEESKVEILVVDKSGNRTSTEIELDL